MRQSTKKGMKFLQRSLAAVGLVAFFSGCASVPVINKRAESLQELCVRYSVSCDVDAVSQVVTLRRGEEKAEALIGSNVVMIGSESIILSAPLTRQREGIEVPADFQHKIIRRLLKKKPGKALAFKILIDAGHGGRDPGAIGFSGTKEKEIVLDIAKRLERLLKTKGFKVVLSRKKDEFVTLQKRTEIASKQHADLFISIHANASPSRRVSGVEVYSSRNVDAKGKKEEQRRRNRYLTLKDLAIDSSNEDVKVILNDMLYDYKISESKRLAARIAKQLSGSINTKNLGNKESKFFVLRNTLVPAVLVEVGFLSNPKEERLLKTPSYRQKIAEGISESIYQFIKH